MQLICLKKEGGRLAAIPLEHWSVGYAPQPLRRLFPRTT